MLTAMREHASSYLIKAVLGLVVITFIGTIFLVWGYGGRDNIDQAAAGPSLATVNGEAISSTEFYRMYDQSLQTLEQFRSSISPAEYERLTAEMKKSTLESLVANRLLILEARRMGLSVKPDEVRDSIESLSQFQTNGVFDPRLFAAYLDYTRTTQADLEGRIATELLAQKASSAIRSAAVVTEAEVQREFYDRNQKVTVTWAAIDPVKYLGAVSATDAEITRYYEGHTEEFRKPATFSFRYLEFSPAQFAGDASVSNSDAAAYYAKYQERFTRPERVRARHILFASTGGDTTENETLRRRATEVLAKLRGGADFAAAAKEFSSDRTNRDKGGEIGLIARGQLPAEIETPAFALAPGEISEPVESPAGIHLIKVDEKLAEEVLPFREVQTLVVSELLRTKARDLAFSRAEEALSTLLEGKSMEDVAARHGIAIAATEPMTTERPSLRLGLTPDRMKLLSALAPQEYSEVIETETGSFIFVPLLRTAERIPPVAEVREEVAAKVKTGKAVEVATVEARRMTDEINRGKGIAEVAKSRGLTVETAGPFSRQDPPTSVSDPRAFGNRVFSIKTPGRAADPLPTDSAVYVIVLSERKDPDPATFAASRPGIRSSLLTERGETLLTTWVKGARAKAKVDINSQEVQL
jgi:peptidyl-prolyl cis-trans isomerase D